MAPKVAEKAVKAPATKAPAAKKVVKKATAGASKKKVKAVESYKIYIYKVLKQVGAHLPYRYHFTVQKLLTSFTKMHEGICVE